MKFMMKFLDEIKTEDTNNLKNGNLDVSQVIQTLFENLNKMGKII